MERDQLNFNPGPRKVREMQKQRNFNKIFMQCIYVFLLELTLSKLLREKGGHGLAKNDSHKRELIRPKTSLASQIKASFPCRLRRKLNILFCISETEAFLLLLDGATETKTRPDYARIKDNAPHIQELASSKTSSPIKKTTRWCWVS